MEKQECGLLDKEMMVSLLSDMLLDGAYGCFYLLWLHSHVKFFICIILIFLEAEDACAWL